MAENAIECAVCCNNLNHTTRRLVSCDFCPYVACLACTKTYSLSTVHQPHCMNCRKEWSIEMMNKHFPKTFLRDEYRKMRETILFEEEKTYLPPLQAEAERILTLTKLEKEERAVQKRVAENHANEDQLCLLRVGDGLQDPCVRVGHDVAPAGDDARLVRDVLARPTSDRHL